MDYYFYHTATSYALTQFKTPTFGLLLLKIVVKLTFFSNAIPMLNICLLQLFFYAFAYAFAMLLELGEKKFSSSRGGKVDQISRLFPPSANTEILCLLVLFAVLLSLLVLFALLALFLCLLLLLFSPKIYLGCGEN